MYDRIISCTGAIPAASSLSKQHLKASQTSQREEPFLYALLLEFTRSASLDGNKAGRRS